MIIGIVVMLFKGDYLQKRTTVPMVIVCVMSFNENRI